MAFKDIEVGEELTYDYAMGNLVVENFPDCQCGSEKCRKVINGYQGISEDLKKEYKGYIHPFLVEYDLEKKKKA